MKKGRFFLVIVLGCALQLRGQCNSLFFSEYVEGYYNNKALEIYNPTSQALDLKNFRISTWHNGEKNFTNWFTDTLTGTIASNAVLVIVINKQDASAVGLDTIVTLALRKKANLYVSANKYASMSMNFNGDDPISLEEKTNQGWQMIDLIGRIGEQPQLANSPSTIIGWSDSAPFNNGKGLVYTKDHTLIRKAAILNGIRVNPASYNPKTEWTIYKVNMFDSLGTHRCNCNKYAAATQKVDENRIRLFPNPAKEMVYIFSSFKIDEVQITDILGRKIEVPITISKEGSTLAAELKVENLLPGAYAVKCLLANGKMEYSQFIKE